MPICTGDLLGCEQCPGMHYLFFVEPYSRTRGTRLISDQCSVPNDRPPSYLVLSGRFQLRLMLSAGWHKHYRVCHTGSGGTSEGKCSILLLLDVLDLLKISIFLHVGGIILTALSHQVKKTALFLPELRWPSQGKAGRGAADNALLHPRRGAMLPAAAAMGWPAVGGKASEPLCTQSLSRFLRWAAGIFWGGAALPAPYRGPLP